MNVRVNFYYDISLDSLDLNEKFSKVFTIFHSIHSIFNQPRIIQINKFPQNVQNLRNIFFTPIPPTLELKLRYYTPLFELDFLPPNFGARDGKNRGNGLDIGQDRGKI